MMNAQNDGGRDPRHDEAARQPFDADGGEDEGSTAQEGDDAHLNDDQKSSSSFDADAVDADDPHKAQKLTRAGRPLDLDERTE